MRDLVEFLNTRLDEETKAALEAKTDFLGWLSTLPLREPHVAVQATHAMHWQPARVLDEIAARRHRIDLILNDRGIDHEGRRRLLLAEAAAYARHPQFRDEWRVSPAADPEPAAAGQATGSGSVPAGPPDPPTAAPTPAPAAARQAAAVPGRGVPAERPPAAAVPAPTASPEPTSPPAPPAVISAGFRHRVAGTVDAVSGPQAARGR